MDRLLTRGEVAELFRVSTKTVQRWRKDPIIPLNGFSVGRRVLFTEAELRSLTEWGKAKEYAA